MNIRCIFGHDWGQWVALNAEHFEMFDLVDYINKHPDWTANTIAIPKSRKYLRCRKVQVSGV